MTRTLTLVLVLTLAANAVPASALAHCDTTQGPVVTAARTALDKGDPNLVMHWVRPEDEASISETFQQAMAVRELGPEARVLADRAFFETLVRIHRAGEGAPYTGLSHGAPEPIILATDQALERGSADELEEQLVAAVRGGLESRFAAAKASRDFEPGDVAAGRAFVANYVPLTHWVEGVLQAATGKGEHHGKADEHALGSTHASSGHTEHAAPTVDHGGDHAAKTADHGEFRLALPWILSGFLAVVALGEAAFLVRRRRDASA